jgi:CRP-like cAMP-binding protein
MTQYTAPADLQTALKQNCERVRRRRGSVLFRRGENALGMFVVLAGKVTLDFGVDSKFARSYGPGALVGLPATLTRRTYSMTATVIDDAELGFWSLDDLDLLLQRRRDFCRQLLVILGERMAENRQMAKALLAKDEQPEQHSAVV